MAGGHGNNPGRATSVEAVYNQRLFESGPAAQSLRGERLLKVVARS